MAWALLFVLLHGTLVLPQEFEVPTWSKEVEPQVAQVVAKLLHETAPNGSLGLQTGSEPQHHQEQHAEHVSAIAKRCTTCFSYPRTHSEAPGHRCASPLVASVALFSPGTQPP